MVYNAPSHTLTLDEPYPIMKVVCLPTNMTLLLQQMDQILYGMKHYATVATDVEERPAINDFWRGYNLYAVTNIRYPWN
jgi:hypothetical protein